MNAAGEPLPANWEGKRKKVPMTRSKLWTRARPQLTAELARLRGG